MSQFSEFLNTQGFKTDEVVVRSAAVEKLTPEERELLVKRTNARRLKKSYEELSLVKAAKLGRGVSPGVAQRAVDGVPIPRVARKKLTRAVNSLLTSAKKDVVDTRLLFADVSPKKGKKKK